MNRIPPAVAAIDVSKTYGDAPALSPLTLEIPAGQRVVVVGHNGSGKTTFLRIAAGLLEPSSGSVTISGHPVGSIESRAYTSYLGDQPAFYDDLSLWEHLEYVARLHDTEGWEQHGVELLALLGIDHRADDLPTTFSRGLRQKAAIALAFVRPFEVLLVDEPFVGLDRTGREALLELFRRAHRDGATLVVATHELTTVREADRLIALRDGEVIHDGSPHDADADELVTRRDGTGDADDSDSEASAAAEESDDSASVAEPDDDEGETAATKAQ